MNLTNEDVEEIIRLLDATTYTDLHARPTPAGQRLDPGERGQVSADHRARTRYTDTGSSAVFLGKLRIRPVPSCGRSLYERGRYRVF